MIIILKFDDVVELFSVSDALIMLDTFNQPNYRKFKTGTRDVKLFERGRVKKLFSEKQFVYSGDVKNGYYIS